VNETPYRIAYDTGRWPDDIPEKIMPKKEPKPVAAPANDVSAGPILSNQRGEEDELAALVDQITAAEATAKELAAVKPADQDDDWGAKTGGVRNRLLELRGQVDARRTELKAPYLEKEREIDAAWMPPVKRAKDAADKLRALLEARATRLRNEQIAAERRAREEEAKRAEEARKAAEAGREPPAEPEPPPPPPEPVKVVPRASYGRAAGVKPVKVVTIVDVAACAGYFKEAEQLRDWLKRKAEQLVNLDGFDAASIPGITIHEEVNVR
jgi:hypothetical protein